MKVLRSEAIGVVDLTLKNSAGEIVSIMLHKRDGRWRCPTMTYLKQTTAGFWASYGLRDGWEPSKQMIRAAEKAL